MAKIEKPELFFGNYVKFEKSRHRKDCFVNSYETKIHDYRTLFLKLANGNIIDFLTKEKVITIDLADLKTNCLATNQKCVTNLIPASKYYNDLISLHTNPKLITQLINNFFNHSESWLNIENVSIDSYGLFNYSGPATKEQLLIMTAEDVIASSIYTETENNNKSYDIDEDLYIAFVVNKINLPYQEGILTNNYKMFPEVRLFKKTSEGYVDFYTNELATEFNLSHMEKQEYKQWDTEHIFDQSCVGYCNFINLENFLITSSIAINPEENIVDQINSHYVGLDPILIYYKIPEVIYPSLESVLKRNLIKK